MIWNRKTSTGAAEAANDLAKPLRDPTAPTAMPIAKPPIATAPAAEKSSPRVTPIQALSADASGHPKRQEESADAGGHPKLQKDGGARPPVDKGPSGPGGGNGGGADKGGPFNHQPPEGHAKTTSAVLGELVWLMSQSQIHKQFFISDLEWPAAQAANGNAP